MYVRSLSVKKTIIAAALVLSLAIVACDDGGDATAEPTEPAPAATEAAAVTEAPAEVTEAPAAETEAPAEEAAESPAA